ncbi:ORF6N domain-containing protein [Agriterribacter sp.]|uniref:ORF6N domain-containing protein n=1 Tax=Agriterribacter sp. TaxID=2821509 RepID=UPI002C44FDAC|nr:ORF6N domain-containing protein [Agriterribacter sp.]HRO46318.1 ORF6N domain-containing protein [Agriterribacter sp.]
MTEAMALTNPIDIRSLIYTVRDRQIILDRDLAVLYQVETKNLNKAVKRNSNRFPESFCFQLTQQEAENLRFQFGTSSSVHGGNRYFPYAFTESGIAMASAVLHSQTAIKVSVQIMEAFVEMRRFIIQNGNLFCRLERIEIKQSEADLKFEELFKALDSDKLQSDKGIFYDGQIFDAYSFVADIIRSAKRSIILIDNYVDDTVLTLLGKRGAGVSATIYTKNFDSHLQLDLQRYNSQYPNIKIQRFSNAHDRFILLDGMELYHIGASLKDLGKKWFAFSKIDREVSKMLGFLNDT